MSELATNRRTIPAITIKAAVTTRTRVNHAMGTAALPIDTLRASSRTTVSSVPALTMRFWSSPVMERVTGES
jgi:hypothetical protein